MGSINHIHLQGNITKDIELRPVGENQVINFDIAVADGYGDKKKTVFVPVTFWGKSASIIAQYCGKGSGIYVSGKLQMDEWQDRQTGQKKTKLKVFGLGFEFNGNQKGTSSPTGNYGANDNYNQQTNQFGPPAGQGDELDPGVPF